MDCHEFESIKKKVCEKLKGLNPLLTYHNICHTLDVVEQSERIAKEEGMNEDDIYLLKVAALYHDTGFLKVYRNHEEAGCGIFLIDADDFHFTENEKQKIQGLIMATKVPQQPRTHLEEIICDADLDYLGRNDFFDKGDELRKELINFGFVENEEAWDKLQIEFLSRHRYFTKTCTKLREPLKQQHFLQLV